MPKITIHERRIADFQREFTEEDIREFFPELKDVDADDLAQRLHMLLNKDTFRPDLELNFLETNSEYLVYLGDARTPMPQKGERFRFTKAVDDSGWSFDEGQVVTFHDDPGTGRHVVRTEAGEYRQIGAGVLSRYTVREDEKE